MGQMPARDVLRFTLIASEYEMNGVSTMVDMYAYVGIRYIKLAGITYHVIDKHMKASGRITLTATEI